MSRQYIQKHFSDIKDHANAIEARLDDSDLDAKVLIDENERNLALCGQYSCGCILINDVYDISI